MAFNPGQRNQRQFNSEPSEFYEKVVQVNRVSKKTQGGDVRSLSVIVVVGDRKGRVGVGLGKAKDAQSAVRKATAYAKKHLITIALKDERTIFHEVYVKNGAAKVLLKPAPMGRGVIAGGPVRVVVEAAGIKDVVSKTLGTSNKASNVYATLEALRKLRPMKVEVAKTEKSDESTSAKASVDKSEKARKSAKKETK